MSKILNEKSLFLFLKGFILKQKWSFLFIFLFSFIWALDATLWPYILRLVISILEKFESHRENAWLELRFPVMLGALFFLFIELGFRCQGFLLAKSIPRLEANIRMTMFDHIEKHSPQYFNERFAGSLANKITDMVTQTSSVLQEIFSTFIPAVAGAILGTLFFFWIHPYFALLLFGWIFMHFTICLLFSKKCSAYEHIHGESRSSLLGKVVDSFSNNFAVNLFYRFAGETAYIERFQAEEEKKNRQSKRYVEIMRIFLGLNFLISFFSINGLMIYSWMHGKISLGEVAQIFNTNWNICLVIWYAGMAIPGMFQSIGIMKQAYTVMLDPKDILDLKEAKPLIIKTGKIEFEKVGFDFGQKALFKDKNVFIKGGEKVGLVGYSGAGKSSFVSLILRLHKVKKGRILIDGQDISSVTLESLRRQIALIPQDPVLFHRTLKENIRFSRPEATDKDVYEAAALAHCDKFIMKLPSGYDSLVGERGTQLSGGERQRIAIARAILVDAPILILDEATSSLDSVTESYIQESLEWLMRGRTTIAIAHRLSTLNGMDRILVFDEGQIIEEGTHKELLSKKGLYSRMWKMQAGGFLPSAEGEEEKQKPSIILEDDMGYPSWKPFLGH